MPVRIHFDFVGTTQVDRTLANYERADDMRPAWEVLEERFFAAERRQFRSEGAAGGSRWRALSPAYGAWKAAHFPGTKILHREGDLERSLTQRGAGGNISVIEYSYAIFGTSEETAGWHQHGTSRMPKREVVALDELERREWVRVIQRFLATGHAR